MTRSLLSQEFVSLRRIDEDRLGETVLARLRGAPGFDREVVLRRIRRIEDHPRVKETFLEDIRNAAAVTHPNVLQIYDVGEEDGRYFVASERLRGSTVGTLADKAQKAGQRISTELAVTIVTQVLEGLRYLHGFRDTVGRALPIVHGHLCPSTVFASYDGSVKILDLGTARAQAQLWGADLPQARLAYVPPEMIKGDMVDARADVFGVGVLLYELTVGQRVFRGATYEELRRGANSPIPPPTFSRAGYPADLEILVMRAIEIDPADRFEGAEAMLEELEQFAFNTGLRVSRLRLGRFVSKIIGEPAGPLDEVASTAGEEATGGPPADDLDFDREGLFERTAETPPGPPPAESLSGARMEQVMEAVQQAKEAIADLVAAADTEIEEGRTAEMRAADQATLRARTVPPAELERRDGSAVIVTEELVEEETDLPDPGHDLILEPPLVGARLVEEPAAQPSPEARAVRPSASPPPTPPPDVPREISAPAEASPDLIAALADISAELRAGAESDRRREQALELALELVDDETLVSPPPSHAPPPKASTGQGMPWALRRPPSQPEEPFSDIAPLGDELELTDGIMGRAPDELELADSLEEGSPPRGSRPTRRPPPPRRRHQLGSVSELEGEEGDTIALEPGDAGVEVVAEPSSPGMAAVRTRAKPPPIPIRAPTAGLSVQRPLPGGDGPTAAGGGTLDEGEEGPTDPEVLAALSEGEKGDQPGRPREGKRRRRRRRSK